MCTSLKMKSENDLQLLARTMDFSFDIFPDLVVVPRNYEFNNFDLDSNEIIVRKLHDKPVFNVLV